LRNLLSGIKKVFIPASDEHYWNEKAAELEYLAKSHNGDITESQAEFSKPLGERAKIAVGRVNFDLMLANLDVDTDYIALSSSHIVLAVKYGLIGTLIGHLTNVNADQIEEILLKLHGYFKPDGARSPLDYHTGAKHRYTFGHDLNIFQELPPGYTIGGNEVGGKSLYSLVLDYIKNGYPDCGAVTGHIKAIMHILTHLISDLPTKDGIPLPFTSLFTKWIANPDNVSGYSAKNPVMDFLGREFGTINAADVTAYATIKLLVKSHHAIEFYKSDAEVLDKDLILAQMNTIAYGTSVIVQMFILITNPSSLNAKLNHMIVWPFMYNAGRAQLLLLRQHKDVLSSYEESLALLESESMKFDEWVSAQ